MYQTDLLFENYELFLKENVDQFSSPKDAFQTIADEASFAAFKDALTEGLDPATKVVVESVLNRQREELLTEAVNVPASAYPQGWTVMSFPILVDIYAEPILAQLATVYPVNSSVASIPRVNISAKIRSYDGSTSENYRMPNAVTQLRPGLVTVTIAPNDRSNLFAAASLSSDKFRINRRYVMISKVSIVDNDGSNNHDIDVTVYIRPDNRSQFNKVFTFQDSAGATVTAYLNGNVNFDTGDMIYQVSFSGGTSGHTYTASGADVQLRFVPVGTMNGRVEVNIKTDMIDVNIDEVDDFIINVSEEDIQDYKSIFKIDLVQTLSEAIKRQILLNKDVDLALFLKAAEGDMSAQGAALSIDLNNFAGSSTNYQPASTMDVMKNIIPRISTLMGIIKRNYHAYPNYIVTGIKTASALRNFQKFAASIPNDKEGAVAWAGEIGNFMKLNVLESPAIDDDKIYVVAKAPANALQKACVIDLVYKPLYVINEVTDGQKRTYVKSRTAIEIGRTDGMGVLTVDNLSTYVG